MGRDGNLRMFFTWNIRNGLELSRRRWWSPGYPLQIGPILITPHSAYHWGHGYWFSIPAYACHQWFLELSEICQVISTTTCLSNIHNVRTGTTGIAGSDEYQNKRNTTALWGYASVKLPSLSRFSSWCTRFVMYALRGLTFPYLEQINNFKRK